MLDLQKARAAADRTPLQRSMQQLRHSVRPRHSSAAARVAVSAPAALAAMPEIVGLAARRIEERVRLRATADRVQEAAEPGRRPGTEADRPVAADRDKDKRAAELELDRRVAADPDKAEATEADKLLATEADRPEATEADKPEATEADKPEAIVAGKLPATGAGMPQLVGISRQEAGLLP